MVNVYDDSALTLHGGGEGFEFPRLHLGMYRFAGKTRTTNEQRDC